MPVREQGNLTQQLLPWRKAIGSGVTWRGWRSPPSGKPLIQFVHGNGLCCLAYAPFLQELLKSYDLFLFDLPGHGDSDAAVPFPGWEQQADMMTAIWDDYRTEYNGTPCFGLGHSMGAVLTLLRASRCQTSFSRICLLDPVLLSPTMILGARLDRLLHARHRQPHAEHSRQRVDGWPDEHAAFRFFHCQPFFRSWSSASLNAYIRHALKRQKNELKLKCAPETEARAYYAKPVNLWRTIKQLDTGTDILFGSKTFPFIARSVAKACLKNRLITRYQLPGDHCFVQARPNDTARLVAQLFSGAEHAHASSV